MKKQAEKNKEKGEKKRKRGLKGGTSRDGSKKMRNIL